MRQWPLLAVMLLLASLSARAQDVIVRTSRQPAGPVMLGEPVHLLVDVLFPDGMQHPPRVDAPLVAGAQVFRFESQATTTEDRTGKTPIVGQRFVFDLYARRAGTLAVPPFKVTLLDPEGVPAGTRTGAPLTVEAVVPPGLDSSGPIVASSEVTVKERWDPPESTAGFHVGDALVRLVIRQAADVPGLALAALAFPAPDGVRAYVDPPVIEDSVERGAVTGLRTDRVVYVFERPGAYTLPGLVQPWWNLDSRSAHVLSRPARHVEVTGTETADPSLRRVWWVRGGIFLALLLVSIWLTAWTRRRLVAAQHVAETNAEWTAFRSLDRACRRADAASVYRAWQRWNALRTSRAMPPELSAALAPLERHLLAQTGEWDATAARRLASAARSARTQVTRRPRPSTLPPLNPLASAPDENL
jgi:hypothetical protein